MGWWPDEYNHLFEGLSEQEALELAEDLLEPDPNDGCPLVNPPEEEYLVPSIYVDCRPEKYRPGYPDNNPYASRVITLPRGLYPEDKAKEKFKEMMERNNWRPLEEMFYTATKWCMRIEEMPWPTST